MAPNGKGGHLQENGLQENTNEESTSKRAKSTHLKLPKEIGTDYTFKRKIVWFNAIGFLIMHLCALYGYYLCSQTKWKTFVWSK